MRQVVNQCLDDAVYSYKEKVATVEKGKMLDVSVMTFQQEYLRTLSVAVKAPAGV
jgi:hypothetical protein